MSGRPSTTNAPPTPVPSAMRIDDDASAAAPIAAAAVDQAAMADKRPITRRIAADLAARGLYAEPTSAVAAAALDHYLGDGTIGPDDTTVLVLTGSGLKAADLMADVFAAADR